MPLIVTQCFSHGLKRERILMIGMLRLMCRFAYAQRVSYTGDRLGQTSFFPCSNRLKSRV